jgi:hypothetical protein
MASAPFLAANCEGSRKYFHAMNGYWNTVNFALAGVGLLRARKESGSLSASETLERHIQLEQTLLFNAGLDLAYMTAGLYLMERAKGNESRSDQLKGFGQSLMLQGGFLCLFDLFFYRAIRKNRLEVMNWMEKVNVGANGIKLTHKF